MKLKEALQKAFEAGEDSCNSGEFCYYAPTFEDWYSEHESKFKNLNMSVVVGQSEQLPLCENCGCNIDKLDNWCKRCGEAKGTKLPLKSEVSIDFTDVVNLVCHNCNNDVEPIILTSKICPECGSEF